MARVRCWQVFWLIWFCWGLSPVSVWGAGFAVLQQGTAAMAQGNAFVAQADDASAIFYNPAGLLQLTRPTVYFNTVLSSTSRHYDGPGGYYATARHKIFAIPSFYAVYPLSDRWVAGLGLFTPFGLGTEWPSTWAGRYLITLSKLQTYNLNPVLAVKLHERLSFAAGFNVLWSRAKIARRVINPLAPFNPAADLKMEFDGDGAGFGFNLGLLWEPWEAVKFGVHYRSAIAVRHRGDYKFTGLNAVGGAAEVEFPPSVTFGASCARLKPFTFEVDVTWTGWSTYDSLDLYLDRQVPGPIPGTFTNFFSQNKDWRDAWAFRFGVNYELRPGWKLRAGYIYDLTPVPASTFEPSLPDANRHIFTFGGDIQLKRFTLGLAYNYIRGENRSKANTIATNGVPLPAPAQANGKYKSDNHSLGLSLAYSF